MTVLATHSFAKPLSDSEEKMPAGTRSEADANSDALEPLLTIDEVSRIIGRTHWTLRRDIKAGKLKCVRIGQRIMIEPSEIRTLIQEAREKHGSR
jgi:Helix-turn-helix domain